MRCIEKTGSSKNYVMQNFWTLTYCYPLTRKRKWVYQGVTVMLKIFTLSIFLNISNDKTSTYAIYHHENKYKQQV